MTSNPKEWKRIEKMSTNSSNKLFALLRMVLFINFVYLNKTTCTKRQCFLRPDYVRIISSAQSTESECKKKKKKQESILWFQRYTKKHFV